MLDGLFIDTWSLTPSASFTHSELSWSIASDLSGRFAPNILSELNYRDLQAQGLGFTLARLYPVNDNLALYAELMLSRSVIQDGSSQDSDYQGNRRSQEFSRSYADVDSGLSPTRHFSVGLKMRLPDFPQDFFSVLIGRHRQVVNLTKTNGVIVLPDTLNGEKLEDLNSTYNSQFDSWSFGISQEHLMDWGTLSCRYDYYDTEFNAEANWNLRTDFAHPVSFIHQGFGEGHSLQLGYAREITNTVQLQLHWQRSLYQIDPGYDVTFFTTRQPLATRLNQVNYASRQVQIGISYIF